jgi:hypothetical protein
MRRLATCLALALVASGCGSSQQVVAPPATEFFSASLNGANQVPPSGSTATGTATFAREGNVVTFDVEVAGIVGATLSHIHSGAEGVAGPVRVNLFLGPETGPLTGRLASGSFTPADVQGISFDALLAEMRNGTAFVNVHTAAFPGGEIRGQIRPSPTR